MTHELYILTGASRGMGAAIAVQLLGRPGTSLLCISRHTNAALDAAAEESGAHCEQWAADLAQPGVVAARLENWLAALDGTGFASASLVNNAGVLTTIGPLEACTGDELSTALRVGLEAPLLLSAAFLRATAAWPGKRRVLNISSGLGRRAMAGQATYCAAKAGMDNLSRAVALDQAGLPNGAASCPSHRVSSTPTCRCSCAAPAMPASPTAARSCGSRNPDSSRAATRRQAASSPISIAPTSGPRRSPTCAMPDRRAHAAGRRLLAGASTGSARSRRCTGRAFAALASAWLVAGCAPLPVASPMPAAAEAAASGPVLLPNLRLIAQGIPPIPKSLADDVARYAGASGRGFVDWHPARPEMLVNFRKAGDDTAQIFRVASPQGRPEQLTQGADPVRRALYEPLMGDSVVFERSSGGDEAAQIERLDLATHAVTTVSEPDRRNDMQRWLHRSSRLLYIAMPLDRTATGGRRAEVMQSLILVDPAHPETRRVLAELPGGGWDVGGVSWNDGTLALTRYLSATESEVWLLDVASGERRKVLPAAGETAGATHLARVWKHDDTGFFVVSDRAGEFRELMFYSLAASRLLPVSPHVRHDVSSVSLSADGRIVAAEVDVDGRGELMFFDADTFDELPTPGLPPGSVVAARFHPALPMLAYAIDSNTAPSRIGSVDPNDGKTTSWMRAEPTRGGDAQRGIDTQRFGEQRIVHWKSFDGLDISGIVNLPPARFAGRRPVLVDIHGGPEGEARFGFIGRQNYLVEELGIAVIRPNVRGSRGFGKHFLALDDGMKREDSVKDIGALLDWIATQPHLDASHVVVSGGSYGGYVSLAVATHYADRIAGSIDVVGIANFLTFLQDTESYRRDLRRVEYGDKRDPAMRDFLARISPLTDAAKIVKPLFVVAGRNDPRVPYTEAEQIVTRVRANGTTVWYLLAANEGHGFARKDNADYQFYATVMFLRRTLLGDSP